MTPILLRQSGEITDAAGNVWRVHDLRAITVMIMLFTMVFTTMLEGFRLADDDSPPQLNNPRRRLAKTVGAALRIRFYGPIESSSLVGSSGSAVTKMLTRLWKLAPWDAATSHQADHLERLTNLAPGIHQFALQLFFGRRAAASYDC